MRAEWADNLWVLMRQDSYYSIRDLTILSGQPGGAVADAVKFLTKYGFVKRLGTDEPLFTKTPVKISPADTINLLQRITNTPAQMPTR